MSWVQRACTRSMWSLGEGLDVSVVIGRNYGVLAAIIDVAVKDRRLSVNPARGVDLPKGKKARWYLTHEDVWAVADAAGSMAP